MSDPRTHDRLNEAVAAHLAVAMEAQDALSQAVDLSAPYQADIGAAQLVVGGRALRVLLLGTVSKQSNTWLWSWANQGFSPDSPAIAPVRAVAQRGAEWGLWELQESVFDLTGVTDTGLGGGASVALLGSILAGGVGFYGADYGAGIAYFAVVDPSVPRPAADGVSLPRRILNAVDLAPGHGRGQLLTYAAVHDLRVRSVPEGLEVHLAPGDVVLVQFDEQNRPSRFSAQLG